MVSASDLSRPFDNNQVKLPKIANKKFSHRKMSTQTESTAPAAKGKKTLPKLEVTHRKIIFDTGKSEESERSQLNEGAS